MRDLIMTSDNKMKIFKAINQGGLQLKEFVGDVLTISDIIQTEAVRKNTGEEAVSTTLITVDGDVYSTLSPTVDDSVHKMVNVFGTPSAENPFNVRVEEGKSKNGRGFLFLSMAE